MTNKSARIIATQVFSGLGTRNSFNSGNTERVACPVNQTVISVR